MIDVCGKKERNLKELFILIFTGLNGSSTTDKLNEFLILVARNSKNN